MIIIVGSRNDTFHFTAPNKTIFYTEDDQDNFYYNEMCGHKYILQNFDKFRNDPYVGLEHYRRAFDFSDAYIRDLLNFYDIIVKPEHGPYGSDTNLSVLAHCSRHGLDYLEQAKEWVERFPELREQANATTHFGCNMMLVKPQKYKEMMEEEFSYIDEIMKTPNLQRASVSYFCETIITPYIIRKHNKNICVGRVLTHM